MSADIDNGSIASLDPVNSGSLDVNGLAVGSTFWWWSYEFDHEWDDGYNCQQASETRTDNVPEDVQCTQPTGESSTFGGWDDEDGKPTIAKWNQTLLPTSTNLAGRFVTETDPGGGSDGCHFPNSEIDEVTAVNGTTWSVTSGNHWGPDGNGLFPSAVSYYQSHNRAPCTITIPQQMYISCGLNPINYVTHTLTYTIGTQTVRSEHNGGIAVRAWP